jgi:formate/nitrite transporter FocA (FNT family)
LTKKPDDSHANAAEELDLKEPDPTDRHTELDHEESEDVDRHRRLKSVVVYEVIRREGDEELRRPFTSLWWSGIAAGLAISTSVFAEGYLHMHLPDAPWRPLVENFGYCVGFVIVILGRFQLFTEHTITAMLPLLANRTRRNLYRTSRLWITVLSANMVGTFAAATMATHAFAMPEQLEAFLTISHHFAEKTPLETLLHGVPAGFFVAALVWMLPAAKGSEFLVIILMTYIIALGEFAHVVAGSTEVFLLFLDGSLSFASTVFSFIIPAFVGNVIGGSVLFTLIAYGQVSEEI